jgi:Protocatechuate 3,4-dioxygenase beta subunit
METDAKGHFVFQTKFPGRYLTNKAIADSYRPSHIHFKITPKDKAYGGPLTTQLYFENGRRVRQVAMKY